MAIKSLTAGGRTVRFGRRRPIVRYRHLNIFYFSKIGFNIIDKFLYYKIFKLYRH